MTLHKKFARSAIAALAFATVAGCATTPTTNPQVQNLRSNLTTLQGDPVLAPRAPVAIKEADDYVKMAEAAQGKEDVNINHLIYLADRKIETARARAEGKLAEDQMKELATERDRVRLDARTREAALARSDAEAQRALATQALTAAQQQQQAAELARQQAAAARKDAANAQQQAASAQQQADLAMLETQEYRRQIAELQAKETDRGLVVTLGDILFATAKADLKAGSQSRLDKVVAFLNKYPDRSVVIEGHTDSVGGEEYNLQLSQRRADQVKAYLTSHGVDANRVSAVGKGKGFPVASNQDAAGRQQNRRVEVVIQNAPKG